MKRQGFLNQTCNNFSGVWELIEKWSTNSSEDGTELLWVYMRQGGNIVSTLTVDFSSHTVQCFFLFKLQQIKWIIKTFCHTWYCTNSKLASSSQWNLPMTALILIQAAVL